MRRTAGLDPALAKHRFAQSAIVLVGVVLDRVTKLWAIEKLEPVITCDDLVAMQEQVKAISITDELLDYVVAIVGATRESEFFEYGASPRASLDLWRFSQATAFLKGRDYVMPDDIKRGAASILAHRVIVKRGTRHGTMNSSDRVLEMLEMIPVPV